MKIEIAFLNVEESKLSVFTYTDCAIALVSLRRVNPDAPVRWVPLAALVSGGTPGDREAIDHALEQWCEP